MSHATVLSKTLLYNTLINAFVNFVIFNVQLNLSGEKWYQGKFMYVVLSMKEVWVNEVIVSLYWSSLDLLLSNRKAVPLVNFVL